MPKKTLSTIATIGESLSSVIQASKNINCIPTGCTLLDLALAAESNNGYSGIVEGRITNIFGDESSGKTLLSLSIGGQLQLIDGTARVYIDDVENALDVVWAIECFGLDPDRTFLLNSDTVESMEKNVTLVCESAKKDRVKALYILDSLDALTTQMEKDDLAKRVRGKTTSDEDIEQRNMRIKLEKSNLMSSFYNSMKKKLPQSGVTLIVISQVRTNLRKVFGDKDDIAGGNATKFYSTHRIKIVKTGTIYQQVASRKRAIGVKTKAKIIKNKVQEPYHEAEFPIYFNKGIDDIEACVDFLMSMKEVNPKAIKWYGRTYKSKKDFILSIKENGNRMKRVKDKVRKTWFEKIKIKVGE